MKRTLLSRNFSANIRIDAEDEQVLLGRPARLSIHEGDILLAEIFIKAEKQQGAGGEWHDAAIFIPSYPAASPKEDKKEVSDDQRERKG